MMILDFIIVFLVSVLSSFGLGGGNFYLLYLTIFKGAEQLEAQGKILFLYLPCAFLSVLIYAHKKWIQYPIVLPMAIGGFLGAVLGGCLLSFLPTKWIKCIFALVLLYQGIKMFFPQKRM